MVKFTLNGATLSVDDDPEMPLLWAIRETAGLTGTKFGCGIGECGACTVHIDGAPTRSCQMPVELAAGKAVVTIEGLSGRAAKAVQAAWRQLDVVQCGYCQSGQIMSAVALLSHTPEPSDRDIDTAMNGNLCRCATYNRIRAAIHTAAKMMEG
ncbi:MAG: (2Fe-2S)-binding domain protein [Rhodospirillales bacterium]|nr:(2Fe-2S)-binding domain protein [Rhodospirillales bacterium]